MPPSPKITKEMITEAGFNIIRGEGEDFLNVRKVAAKLNCSTQPIMYHFKAVDDMKKEIYKRADVFHSLYIMEAVPEINNPMISIGLRYIMFGAKEKYLFRFLFQSSKFDSLQFHQLVSDEGMSPMYDMLSSREDITLDQAKDVFMNLLLNAHGFASLLANESLEYDEDYVIKLLKMNYEGSIDYFGLRRFRKMKERDAR